MFRVPSDDEAIENDLHALMRDKKFFGPSVVFLRKVGKEIDAALSFFCTSSLSPIGELFEIYFVRLIGTPNQNSKNAPASAGASIVVHESLGSELSFRRV